MTLFLKIFKRATNSRANIYYTYAEGDALYTWREEKDEKRKSKYTFFLFSLSLSLSLCVVVSRNWFWYLRSCLLNVVGVH